KAGAAHGSSATSTAESSRGAPAVATIGGVDGGLEATEPARRSDAVHDVAGGLAVAAGALQPAAGRGSWESGSEPDAVGSGRADRVLREHAGAADGSGWRAECAGVARAGA